LSNLRNINFGVEAVFYSREVLFRTLSLVILFTYAFFTVSCARLLCSDNLNIESMILVLD